MSSDDILGTKFHEANICISFVNRITVIVLDFWRAEFEVASAVGAQSPEIISLFQFGYYLEIYVEEDNFKWILINDNVN